MSIQTCQHGQNGCNVSVSPSGQAATQPPQSRSYALQNYWLCSTTPISPAPVASILPPPRSRAARYYQHVRNLQATTGRASHYRQSGGLTEKQTESNKQGRPRTAAAESRRRGCRRRRHWQPHGGWGARATGVRYRIGGRKLSAKVVKRAQLPSAGGGYGEKPAAGHRQRENASSVRRLEAGTVAHSSNFEQLAQRGMHGGISRPSGGLSWLCGPFRMHHSF